MEVAIHGPYRAAVQLHPAPGRWPEHQTADRLALAVGAAAIAASGSSGTRWEPFRTALATLATRVAATPEGPLRGDLVPLDGLGVRAPLEVVAWQGPGRLAVEFEIRPGAGDVVPRQSVRADEAGPTTEIAALAGLIAMAADADPDRLALALAVEGLLAWFRESDRRAPPRNALTFATDHMRRRLEEAGRPVPHGV